MEAIIVAGGGSTYQTRALRVPYASNRQTYVLIADTLPAPGVADLVVTGVRAELPRGLRLIWTTAGTEGESRP